MFPYFSGGGVRREETINLPRSRRVEFLKPEHFRPDPGLVDAVNVALLLGQPLLLTGAPGTGKTQLGRYIAWELRLGQVLKFETKSTSTSTSLFYSYDALKRFEHAKSGARQDGALQYISYNALGKAILFTRGPSEVSRYLPEGMDHPGKSQSVVIIDEIDKAPRDFPNDILNELDQLYFRVPELDNQPITVDDDLRPIVIITSNSERDLPDAFLRRCIFYHIPFPGLDQMRGIVEGHLGVFTGGSSQFLEDSLKLFYALRDDTVALRKKPATAELLEWVSAMRDSANRAPNSLQSPPIAEGDEASSPKPQSVARNGVDNPLDENPSIALQTISVLCKTEEDQQKAKDMVKKWLKLRG
jgi:MoxR-like ATPase